MSEDETRLALLEERVERLQLQQGRYDSNWDSEERNRERMKDRMGLIENRLARIEERIDSGRWNFQSVMTVISTLAAIAALIIMVTQK